jgi:hypothetical protein
VIDGGCVDRDDIDDVDIAIPAGLLRVSRMEDGEVNFG